MTTEPQKSNTSRSPSHVAYHVREAGPGKNFWNRVVCQPADKKPAE